MHDLSYTTISGRDIPIDDIGDIPIDDIGDIPIDDIGDIPIDNIGDVWEDIEEEEDIGLDIPSAAGAHLPEVLLFVDPGDPLTPNKNFPDPFQHNNHDDSNGRTPADCPSINPAHTPTAVFLLYLLLPFAGCNIVLVVGFFIMETMGALLDVTATTHYVTLTTVLSHLGVEPNFPILPCCMVCKEPYPVNTPTDALCSRCKERIPLFQSRPVMNRQARLGPESWKPRLQFPMKSVEAQLWEILVIPGMEDVMESWRSKHRTPGLFTDNFNGDVCQSIPGPDSHLFFENPASHNELRIGLTLGIDWFSYLRSLISPLHTSGPMSLNIINLPPYLRYQTSNILLWDILPGPKEQDSDKVQRFLQILVNELLCLTRYRVFSASSFAITKGSCPPIGVW
ncbi:hypothetical protein K435DRAFT_807010 [Dendrothele bispora CBS 962.96]|uniref:Uncharacterized protein n=1 Tax=Dendrothele bispora (strain CBS 962.96) TaxID=1314807 RepID=A0A4S8L6N6_DENBC|nr:hypothetical protein K435DRAFT_807010 [Dendrothele bispora CBS 962.96]